MRLKFFFFLCLSLLTIIGAQAESVTFNVCSWDAKNKSVTITQLTHDCNPIEGQHWDWMPLGENGKETWYVVKGSDVSRKVLVIFGTVHLVLPDGSKLTCNHIKLEARNNAILHVHGQSSFPGKLNVINYSPDGTREYKDAAAIGSGGGEGNGSGIGGGNDGDGGRVEIYGGTVIAKSNENSGAGIGGGDGGNGGDVHIYGGDVKACHPEG